MADRDQPPPDSRRALASDPRARTGRPERSASKASDASDASNEPGTAGAAPSGEEPSFEAALERLEEIVGRLEEGDLALEDALAGFEEGVRLSRRLADRLADAERRIERLVRAGGGLVERPLGGEGAE